MRLRDWVCGQSDCLLLYLDQVATYNLYIIENKNPFCFLFFLYITIDFIYMIMENMAGLDLGFALNYRVGVFSSLVLT